MKEEAMLIDEIREILRRDHVRFAELGRIEGFAGTHQLMLDAPGSSNILVWSRISQDAADALQALMAAGECYLKGTTTLTYWVDGMMLDLPLARQRRHYKKPYWCPCVLKLGRPPANRRGGGSRAEKMGAKFKRE
jgi:hypothetical protein